MSDSKRYRWHLDNERWEAAMDSIDEDGTVTPHPRPRTIKQVHEKFLAERGHKARRNATRKNLAKDKRTEELK